MVVQRVVMPVTQAESWTVLGDDGVPIAPVEAYLAYLASIERSPHTVRAYATSLKLWFEFLAKVDVAWDSAGVEDVARFVGWLRAPADNVVVLDGGTGVRSAATVNRHLAGVFGFHDHHARSGVVLAADLVTWRRVGRGSYKPFLHHVTKGRPIRTRPLKLAVPRRIPRTLDAEQVVAILGACEHLRDRFLLALLAETGMRVGQALGLRHADFVSRRREVHIVARSDNANGARAKLRASAVIPVSAALVRLYSDYSDYMHAEYGELDSDYVFVNLWGGRRGRPLTYTTVHKLVARVGERAGVAFTPHQLRHTHATDLIRRGVPIEVVARLLTHASSTTTSQTYVHLAVGDIRDALSRAGVLGDTVLATRERAGERVGPFNPILDDSVGWPCLRFPNEKMRADQLIPLSAKAAAAIRDQQDHVRAQWPNGWPWLFPGLVKNPDGIKPYASGTLAGQLRRWQAAIDLRDEAGVRVDVTPHRFRHTVGTRLISSGVPQHVVQKLLGHYAGDLVKGQTHVWPMRPARRGG